MNESVIKELLRPKGKYLFHRENQELEFKESFNLAGLANYFRDFAAFANNRGGYIIFGVKDAPRQPIGLITKSLKVFESIDSEKITGFLLEIFSSDIKWDQQTYSIGKKIFGVFYIYEALTKPIIARKDEGRDQIIKNGDIYYRYGGRTQKIQFAELESIINKRIEINNNQWMDLVRKIGKAGPSNAAILDSERGLIEKDDSKVLLIDEKLVKKLKFIKEGEFVEKKGQATLKLIGDVVPSNKIDIVKKIKENLLKEYPFSAKEVAEEIRKKIKNIKQYEIWNAIKENDLKNNPDYAAYNFRNKKQEDEYKNKGILPNNTPSIYNQNAIDFLVNVLYI